MNRVKIAKSWAYVPLKDRSAAKAAEPQTQARATQDEVPGVGPQAHTPSTTAPPNDPRFNARKHNYTGQHVAITPEEQAEFREIFDGFAHDYGIPSATHLSHIEEASKAKLQIRRVERDLPKAIAESGYDSKKVVLMHRYLKEHRTQLRYALNALMAIRRFDFKREVEGPARILANQARIVNAAIKSTETEFLKTNPGVINDLFKAAGIDAAAPPSQK